MPRLLQPALVMLLTMSVLITACSDEQEVDDPAESATPVTESESELESDVELGHGVVSTGLAIDYPTVDALARASDLVVRGTVTDILDPIMVNPGEPPFEERDPEMYPPTIYTDVVLEVSEFFKGEDEARITIRQVGGTVDGFNHEYEDALDFVPDDDLVLFLADHSEQGYGDVYWVTGIMQGFWEVRPDGDIHPLVDKYEPRNIGDFRDELAEYAGSR